MVTGDRSLSSALLMELRSARPHSMRRIIFRVARPDTSGWARSSVGFCSRSANSHEGQTTPFEDSWRATPVFSWQHGEKVRTLWLRSPEVSRLRLHSHVTLTVWHAQRLCDGRGRPMYMSAPFLVSSSQEAITPFQDLWRAIPVLSWQDGAKVRTL